MTRQTDSGRFLARLRRWAAARLEEEGVPVDLWSHTGGVVESLVERAVRSTPLGGDVTATVARLVLEEVRAHRERAA